MELDKEIARQNIDLFDRIKTHLTNGGSVMVATYTKATIYRPKHLDMFSPGKATDRIIGVYVQRGKRKDYVFNQYLHFSK